MKFVKKPIPIEAVQWKGNNFKEIQEFMGEIPVFISTRNELIIPTLEGDMRAAEESWIIRGVQGEVYPCRCDVFEETYEPVEE